MHEESPSIGGGQSAQAAVDPFDRPIADSELGLSFTPADRQSTTGSFLEEIGAAMLETAQRERDRITRDLTAQLDARIEKLRSGTSGEARQHIRLAESDVTGIREWSVAEQERIRLERNRRIEARRGELERQLSQQDVNVEREIAATTDIIEAYVADLDEFVRRLGQERDPTVIARRASQLPPPPRLEDVAAAAHEQVIRKAASPLGHLPATQLVPDNGRHGSGNGRPTSQASRDLIGVMDPGLRGRIAVSTGEMVGASRPVPVTRPPDGSVESRSGTAAETVPDEPHSEAVSRPSWADVALSFLPLILLVAIAAAVAYVLISGRASGLAG
jgi:hypothetical protein